MNDTVATIAAGVAERMCTRIRAQDRLEALDEGIAQPTLLDRIGSGGAHLHAMVVETLGELLQSLGDARDRDTLRAVHDKERTDASTELMRSGLVVSSWDGSSVTTSALGDAALQLFDDLAADVEARVREGLQLGDAG